jgi:hypothetical protein
MTEVEWLVCEAPWEMYAFLRERMLPRHRHLFARACGRRHCRIWEREKYPNAEEASYWLARKEEIDLLCGKAIEAAEEECDGTNGEEELKSLRNEVFQRGPLRLSWDLTATVKGDLDYWVIHRFQHLPSSVREQASLDAALLWELHAESLFQSDLFRDILGNPFRPVAIDLVWLTPTVVALAQGAYDERSLPCGTLDPNRLAVLADALEDVGCGDADILGHLRGPGLHVRGCWVVDALTGRS